MGTLWQFFGFPDPEAPPPEAMKKSRKKKKIASTVYGNKEEDREYSIKKKIASTV